MKTSAVRGGIEPRWEAAVTLLVSVALVTALPDRLRLVPMWASVGAVFAVLAVMLAVTASRGSRLVLRVERAITLLVIAGAILVNVVTLANLTNAMIFQAEEFEGLRLLTSSVAVWVTNVLVFSLLFWQIDRGGPEARVRDAAGRPDWLFPQQDSPSEAGSSSWRPDFVDYLFLAYSTATAFSTTDVMPLTPRAKLMMMLESTIALVALVVVGARAINILA